MGRSEYFTTCSVTGIFAQPFIGFTKNGVKREKLTVCGSPVGENALLMLEVSGEWVPLTEITTHYNRGMQQSICELTTGTTLRWMGYNSRRPHWIPLMSTTNRKKRLQFARAHQNWTVEDWKNATWSDESSVETFRW